MHVNTELETAKTCRQTQWGRQFGLPTGWRGMAVGHLMALKNASMARLAVDRLDIDPEDRVLEIGFGPGRAIHEAARRATRGLVAGVDLSEVMLRQAERRNRRGIKERRVDLRLGDAGRLPFESASFTRVFEINSFHHWSSPEESLLEIHRVLRPGGKLLLCLRMKHPTRSFMVAPGYTEDEVARVARLVESAGFHDPTTIPGTAGRRVTCVIALR